MYDSLDENYTCKVLKGGQDGQEGMLVQHPVDDLIQWFKGEVTSWDFQKIAAPWAPCLEF